MMTRDFGHGGWAAGCQYNPPPLHVYDTESIAANWFPYERPFIRPVAPGPVLVQIPQPAGSALGDDPTDAGAQTVPRVVCEGMIGRPLIWEGKP
jgi:hypothetical protein